MADLQETLNPVSETGTNPTENSLGTNPWEVQANPFAEQTWDVAQPQETISEQPAPVAPDLSAVQESAPAVQESTPAEPVVNEAPANVTEATPQETSNLADSQAMINAAKKDRLAQMLKAEQEKWKKAWFTKGLLSWVAITACALAVCVVFAKDQVLNLRDDGSTTPRNLEASVVDLT